MPLPDDFHRECVYSSDAWFVTDLLEVDEELVRCRVDTTALGPLVDAQVVLPGHPKHFPGAIMVQLTAVLSNLHVVYGLGRKVSDGWAGFGTHIKSARFPSMGEIGPDVICEARLTRARSFRGTWFTTYTFRYAQDGRTIYESEQTAAWRRITEPATTA